VTIPPKRVRAWKGKLKPARGRRIRVGDGPLSLDRETVEKGEGLVISIVGVIEIIGGETLIGAETG
jgi:hypothetical protein